MFVGTMSVARRFAKTICRSRMGKGGSSLAILLVAATQLNAAEPSASGLELFEKQVQPIFADHCYKCHSHDADKIKGGLLLDSTEAALKGGDTGPAFVPGKPDESLL